MDEANRKASSLKAKGSAFSLVPQLAAELGAEIRCPGSGTWLTGSSFFLFIFLIGDDRICFLGLLHYSLFQNVSSTSYVPDTQPVPGSR